MKFYQLHIIVAKTKLFFRMMENMVSTVKEFLNVTGERFTQKCLYLKHRS